MQNKRKNEHYALCSQNFKRTVLNSFSKRYKYWEIAIPTFTYFPRGLMLYLKDRNNLLLENIQQLEPEYIEELIAIQKDLLEILNH